MFGRKEEGKARVEPPKRFLGRRERYQGYRKIIEEHYPGGCAAFDERWQEDAGLTLCRMMDALVVGDAIGHVRTIVEVYWRQMSEEQQIGLSAMLFENHLRLERALRKKGESVEALIERDTAESEAKAHQLIRSWRESRD